MKKRILVPGGAGFIGSHLYEELLKKGNEVICADNFFIGRKRSIIRLLNKGSKKTINYFGRLLSNKR